MGMENHLDRLSTALKKLVICHPLVASRLEISFYTQDLRFAHAFKGLEAMVNFKEPIGLDFFNELNSADAAFILLAHHNRNFLTTKFFEYLPFRKPLLFLGAEGYVSQFIAANNIGVTLRDDEQILSTLVGIAHRNLVFNRTFNPEAYSLERRVNELILLLK
jgi:hypothetical protein